MKETRRRDENLNDITSFPHNPHAIEAMINCPVNIFVCLDALAEDMDIKTDRYCYYFEVKNSYYAEMKFSINDLNSFSY